MINIMAERHLYMDVETFSSVDIMSAGAYKYTESLDFEILILAYTFTLGGDPVVVDICSGEEIPEEFISALYDGDCILHAHNATFERLAFRAIGHDIPPHRWRCSAVRSAYSGLPLSLDQISKALALGEASKDSAGKALIRYFSIPCKPTKTNGGRLRNMPWHDLEKWEAYKNYCAQDVTAEMAILSRLKNYPLPADQQEIYVLDQQINDRGIKIDVDMAHNAIKINSIASTAIDAEMREISGLANPNSPAQLKQWLESQTGNIITSLDKKSIPNLLKIAEAGSAVDRMLRLRVKSAKTSIKKYLAMINCLCDDGRAHGLFQFYGAMRTGRWAGRLIQLQNLPQNHLHHLEQARSMVASGDFEGISLLYDDLGSTLSQLIRTAFVAPESKTFAVADFSAIEARVIAWLAGEQWRLDVFSTHGKIYEASASAMFGVPISEIGKGSDLRQRGKVAELALGYQGGLGALIQMGGDKLGLSDDEMRHIVNAWRKASPNIVALWADVQKHAIMAVHRPMRERVSDFKGLKFLYDGFVLRITLPSGRCLTYQSPRLIEGKFGKALTYMGMDQVKKTWTRLDTYGGKLVENIVQAIARDCLCESLLRIDRSGFEIVMHVHDEIVAEVDEQSAPESLERMTAIMAEPIRWAPDLMLTADGYVTKFYKKD